MSSSFSHFLELGHAYEVRNHIGSNFKVNILGYDYYSVYDYDDIVSSLIHFIDLDDVEIECISDVQEHYSSNEIESMIDDLDDVYASQLEFFQSGNADIAIYDWIRDNDIVELVAKNIRELQD